jgi:hypothetical protein
MSNTTQDLRLITALHSAGLPIPVGNPRGPVQFDEYRCDCGQLCDATGMCAGCTAEIGYEGPDHRTLEEILNPW